MTISVLIDATTEGPRKKIISSVMADPTRDKAPDGMILVKVEDDESKGSPVDDQWEWDENEKRLMPNEKRRAALETMIAETQKLLAGVAISEKDISRGADSARQPDR